MAEEETVGQTSLHAWDIVVIVIYFLVVLAFGIWSSLRNRGSLKGYFLAGRSMHWIPVGASLFASNIGSGHFIGLAGSGAAGGIGIAAFELNAMFVLLLLGWVFVPVYIASMVFTMPEYLRKRFGGQRIRVYLAVLALLLSIFTKVSADLYAGAVFIRESLHWNIYFAIILLLAIAALFTITGGLTAVIWTDFIQTVIMLLGGAALMIVGFVKLGGYNSVVEQYFQAVPNTTTYHMNHPDIPYNYTHCGVPPANAMHLLRSADDGSLPWTGIIFGLTISSIWYWCSDQVIVQRALAAKNISHAKAGVVLAAYLKILPMWIMVLPGMMARILFPNTVACADPDVCEEVCGTRTGCTNIAYPKLVIELMPIAARGLMLAVMMAALMSSLTSIFNSSSTIFTVDIWCRFRKNASQWELLIVGRVFVLFMVAIGIVWIPIVQSFAELFHYIQSITSYLSPPICAVYILAVSWKRINEQGAFWGLMVGLVVGLIRFIWEFSYTAYPCGEEYKDSKPAIISKVHYLHFGCILWLLVVIVTVVISLLTKPIPDECLHRLTFASRFSQKDRIDISVAEEMEKKSKALDNPALEVSKDVTVTAASSTELEIEPEPTPVKRPWWKKALFWVCGIEKQGQQPELTDEQRLALEKKQRSLHEDHFWRIFLNVMAVVVMAVAIFFWGFFY